ncbi:hypothetical protein EJ07DRAFT_72866, partial [Lizonia empirigonia]
NNQTLPPISLPTMTNSTPALPTPPFYNIPSLNNLRDAATTLTTPTGPLRPGILFRSGEVSQLDHSGWTAVHSIGVAHVFDLRSKPEVERGWASVVGKDANGKDDVRPGWIEAMEGAGVKRSWVPVFAETDYSPEKLAERYVKYMAESVHGYVEAYEDILRNGGAAYREILLYLAGLPPEGAEAMGALIHCTAGKDRTGIFFGILFDFLGVPRPAIADEYNLTELGLAHVREHGIARLVQSPGLKKYMQSLMAGKQLGKEELAKLVESKDVADEEEVAIPPEVREEGRRAALRMVGARKESMLAALEMVDTKFGGSEKYMRTMCGLSDEDLERLRGVLIVQK